MYNSRCIFSREAAFNVNCRAMLWYQGESNDRNPERYSYLFGKFIEMYRSRCGKEIPVIITQLCDFDDPTCDVPEDAWAVLRNEQLKCLAIPKTDLAVTVDIGEYNDLHPMNKKEVGRRLSICARRLLYGDDIVPKGNYCRKAYAESADKIILEFDNNRSLSIKNGGGCFEIIFDDGSVCKAEKEEVAERGIVLSFKDDKMPIKVRCEWDNDPLPCLYGAGDLPLSPFEINVERKPLDMMYDCWLSVGKDDNFKTSEKYFSAVSVLCSGKIIDSAVKEIIGTAERICGKSPLVFKNKPENFCGFILDIDKTLGEGGYNIGTDENSVTVTGGDENGVLYGVFRFIILVSGGVSPEKINLTEKPYFGIRMIDHWDNADGSIERGYAGDSIFFRDGKFLEDTGRITDYARLIASVGINSVCINNVNVHETESYFITDEFLEDVLRLAEIFGRYGIKLFLSVNFAAPVTVDGLDTADPLDENVRNWWKDYVKNIYSYIPNFGGFLVKADSENRPGPFTYGRDHADGANMLADALKPFGGMVIWRCFVYNCHVDWRDRSTDRARAAYDNFKPLDGKFADNVYLQIKNGPMDFQIREAVSPLFGALENTNTLAEFQITQEYTGQQKDLCYLVPIWKECLDFDTYHGGKGSFVSRKILGAAGVSNIGNSRCFTGNPLAGANLYGFGRLLFDPSLSSEDIALEWVRAAVTSDPHDSGLITDMLLDSRDIYESYTSPLGIGWMVVPHYHYGVDVDGYEYSPWGTYHYSDCVGMGVDRTEATGTGYTSQYAKENRDIYENIESCPDELLLFFHHVPYTHVLKSGKTLIQHIYDSHFEGAEKAAELLETWDSLKGKIPDDYFAAVRERFVMQTENSVRWRDVINTYYFRKSGIGDNPGRKIYK